MKISTHVFIKLGVLSEDKNMQCACQGSCGDAKIKIKPDIHKRVIEKMSQGFSAISENVEESLMNISL